VLLDFKKAFDSFSHKILLIKLEHYEVRGPTLALLKSFLQRQQYLSVNGYESKSQSNGYGVPQGSTLGPLLFILYVNDMPRDLQTTPRLFADDTTLILKHSNLAILQKT